MQTKTFTLSVVFLLIAGTLFAQRTAPVTSEDSLNNNISKSSTTIGGYGNAFYQRNNNLGTSKLDLERFVLFTGHKFNDKISVFTELEVEDAKETGGESGGETTASRRIVPGMPGSAQTPPGLQLDYQCRIVNPGARVFEQPLGIT